MFATVTANLLYIHEKELTPNLQHNFCYFSEQSIPLYVIVELEVTTSHKVPMIQGLEEIRKAKLMNKVQDLLNICFMNQEQLLVTVVDHKSRLSELSQRFGKLQKLCIYTSIRQQKKQLVFITKHFKNLDLEWETL